MHWDALFEVVSEDKGYTIKAGPLVEAFVVLLVVLAIIAFYRRVRLVLDKVKVTLPFIGVDTEWVPDLAERKTAWKLFIELYTRTSLQPLNANEGLVREALSSLYTLFQNMRTILQDAGPSVGLKPYSVGYIGMQIINKRLRPLLSKWHPMLQEWEATIQPGIGKQTHEKNWAHEGELRLQLEQLRIDLLDSARELAKVAGVDWD